MGKAKKDFYIVKRKDRLTKSSGKMMPTYYCRFRDESSGELLAWQSTGETSYGRAESWAIAKLRKDTPPSASTLEGFAKDFFQWDASAWIRKQHAKGRRFSEAVARGRQGHLDNHILPKFGKLRLTDLTQKMIEDWLSTLDLSNQTRNHVLYTFRIVLREAKLDGRIRVNPLAEPEAFGVDWKKRDVFTMAELHAFFPEDRGKLTSIWGDFEHATAFLLLADTGMRSGECRGLRWLNFIREKAIYIDSAVDKGGKPKGTKTDAARLVPVSTKARAALLEWRELSKFKEPDDFIFSMERGKPHGDKWLIRALPSAMEGAKVKGTGRNLVVHSFRHTYVTMMENLTTQEEVRLLSGHATEKAHRQYSHPSVEDLMGKLGTASAAVEKIWSK